MSHIRTVSGLLSVLLSVAGCSSDSLITDPQTRHSHAPSKALVELSCTGNIQKATVTCQAPVTTPSATSSLYARANRISGTTGVKPSIIGGQHVNVTLTSSNISYLSRTFVFDVTVKNLLNEALGSIDGITPDTGGFLLVASVDYE